jgi:AhpD family alkylhydroperoxidase
MEGGAQPRLDYQKLAPGAGMAMFAVERYARESGLETPLLELVRLRASQINGCAYCIDMHTKDARVHGEIEQRLYMLSVWREAPFFTPRECAALEWTEAVTEIAKSRAPDDVYERARSEFTETELVNLTMAIVAINGWNRLAIAFRQVAGTYQPK